MSRVSKSITLFKRDLLSLWRWRSNLYSQLIQPTSYLFIYAITMGSQLKAVNFEGIEVSYFTFFMPGMLAMQAFYCFTGTLNISANERRWGLLRTLFLLPVEPESYVFAKALSNSFKLIIQFTLLFTIAIMSNLISISFIQLVNVVFICLLMVLFWTALGATIGVLIKHEQLKSSITVFVTLPLTLLSSIFYSLSNAPKFMRTIASINPLDNQVLVARRAFINASYSMLQDKGFVVLTISVVVAFAFSMAVLYKIDIGD